MGPKDIIDRIMGRQGTKIKALRQVTGALVNIEAAIDVDQKVPCIRCAGNALQLIATVSNLVTHLLEDSMGGNSSRSVPRHDAFTAGDARDNVDFESDCGDWDTKIEIDKDTPGTRGRRSSSKC